MSLNLSNSPIAGGGGSRLVFHSCGVVNTGGNHRTISTADIGNAFVIYYVNPNDSLGFASNNTFIFNYLECDGEIINNSNSIQHWKICIQRPDLFHEYLYAGNNLYYGYIAIPVNNSLTYAVNGSINYVIYAYAE